MAENTRARSAERANLSAAQPSGTTAARERATIDLTSQFNFFFAELRSAVKRPDSLTVGVAGPFDPIGIPDDVNETHAALMSQPNAVSIEELERCLKVVTDLSKKRKDGMLKTITETVNAERDAYVRTKLAGGWAFRAPSPSAAKAYHMPIKVPKGPVFIPGKPKGLSLTIVSGRLRPRVRGPGGQCDHHRMVAHVV